MSLLSNEKGKTDRNNCIKGINYTQIQNAHRKKQRLKIKEDEGHGQALPWMGGENKIKWTCNGLMLLKYQPMFSFALLLHLWFPSIPPAYNPIKPFCVHCLRGEVWLCGKEKITKKPLSFLVQRQMCLEKQKSLDKMPAGGNRGHFLLPRLEKVPELIEHKREGQLASAQVSISVLSESINNKKEVSTRPRWKGPVLCIRVPGKQQHPPEGWWDPKVEETYTLGLNRSLQRKQDPWEGVYLHMDHNKKTMNGGYVCGQMPWRTRCPPPHSWVNGKPKLLKFSASDGHNLPLNQSWPALSGTFWSHFSWVFPCWSHQVWLWHYLSLTWVYSMKLKSSISIHPRRMEPTLKEAEF